MLLFTGGFVAGFADELKISFSKPADEAITWNLHVTNLKLGNLIGNQSISLCLLLAPHPYYRLQLPQ